MENYGTIQCEGYCDVAPPPEKLCGASPIGVHEVADCTSASGTVFDPDYSGSTSVYIYRDGPAGVGVLMSTLVADQPRPDIEAWARTVGYSPPDRTNSGWSWTIPESLKDGTPHSIYTYGINVNSGGAVTGGPHPLLSYSPKTITCIRPPTGIFTEATCTTATGNASDADGVPLNMRIYDGPAGGGGTVIGSGTANPNFSIPITLPPNGVPYILYAYAQDIPSGTWYQLTGSPSVSCSNPPIATITKITKPDYCQVGPEGVVTWQYTSASGLEQKQWQLQVADNPGLSPLIYDSGIKTGSTTTAATGQGILTFGQTYWTRVKVWDINDMPSVWSDSQSFTTPAGQYPSVNFIVEPTLPIAKQPTTFTDISDYANGISTMRQWDFGDGTVITDTPGSPITIHTYEDTVTDIEVKLQVSSTNSETDVCTITKSFNIAKPIPQYKEVLPGL